MSVALVKIGAAASVAGLLLAACAGRSSGTLPAGSLSVRASVERESEATGKQKQTLYVADETSIFEYRAGAKGNVAPFSTIAGSKTRIGIGVGGIAVDSQGVIYASRAQGGVLEFAPGSNGNVRPLRTITASTTGRINGFQVAVDGADNLYVANGGDILVFAPGAKGVATPLADLAGPATTFSGEVFGVAVDAAGHIYAADFTNLAILEFAPGANGNVAPIATIAGSNTTLADPRFVGVSPDGQIYVSDESIVQIFAAGSNGNVAPARTLTFQGGVGPQSNVYVDGNLAFLGQFGENPSASLGVYRAGLSGSSNPLRTIVGSRTKLVQPVGVWVR